MININFVVGILLGALIMGVITTTIFLKSVDGAIDIIKYLVVVKGIKQEHGGQ